MNKLILKTISCFFFPILVANAASISVVAQITPVGFLEIKSSKLLGHITYSKKDATYRSSYLFVPINSLQSNIELRDEHIGEYLGEKKFKNITLEDMSMTSNVGMGELSINGVKRSIRFDGGFFDDKFFGEIKIRMSDYSLKLPKFMGVTVADEIIVKVGYDKDMIEVIP